MKARSQGLPQRIELGRHIVADPAICHGKPTYKGGRWMTRGFTRPAPWDKVSGMSTITAILEADADGTLHLPVPQDMRRGKVKVIATLQTEPETGTPCGGAKPGTPLEALKELRKLGGLRHVIPDPAAWEREQRKERPLPGRD